MSEIIQHQANQIQQFSEMTQDQVDAIIKEKSQRYTKQRTTKTHKRLIKTREGAKGKIFKYVDRITAMDWLDKNYPGWSMEVVPNSFQALADHIFIAVKLTVVDLNLNGYVRTLTCYGCDEAIKSKETKELVPSQYIKSAETDALKRCVFSLGGFTDVYTNDSYADTSAPTRTDDDYLEIGQLIRDAAAKLPDDRLAKFAISLGKPETNLQQLKTHLEKL